MKEYNIKKGKFYSKGIHIKPVYDKKEIDVKVMFDETCLYELDENHDQINKLYGVSQGFHHKDSARYGWRCVGDKIELLAYCYVDGERVWRPIRKVNVNRWVRIKLSITDNYYIFESGDYEIKVARAISMDLGPIKLGYMLFPYFGGKIPAPHDMKIEIK